MLLNFPLYASIAIVKLKRVTNGFRTFRLNIGFKLNKIWFSFIIRSVARRTCFPTLKYARTHNAYSGQLNISVWIEFSIRCDPMRCDELNVVQWNCIASQRIDNLGLDLCATRNYNLNKTNNLIQIMLAWRSIHLSILRDAPMSINICIHKYLQCFRRKLYTPFGISSTWIHIKHI